MKKNILSAVIFFSVVQIAYGASTWTDAYTYELKSSDGWKTKTTENVKMGATKTSDKSGYEVHTVSKTMWSSPKFRLVNSDNAVVSSEVTTAGAGRTATGKNNTGSIGYAYYGSVKPAWNQSGTDRIKLQMRNF